MERSTTDQDLVNSLAETLHAAKLALESALSVSRRDLLEERAAAIGGSNTAKEQIASSLDALQRIGTKGGLGLYLVSTLDQIDSKLKALNIAAVENAKRFQAKQVPVNSSMLIQQWDVTPETSAAHPQFKLDIEPMAGRLMIGLRPVEGDADENCLNASFEVSGTSPAIHIYGGHDNVAITVFSDRKGGILIREGDHGPLADMIVARDFMPEESTEQTDENTGNAVASPNL